MRKVRALSRHEGAAGTDPDQRAHAVALFLTDAVVQRKRCSVPVVVYALGAATGGTLYALLRKSMQASRASM